jgi:hypothetical protein
MVGAVVHTRSQAARTALIKTRSAQRIMYNSADSIRWLDELSASPNLNIESLAAREGKTERWIREPSRSLSFPPPSSKRRSTVDCLAALGSSA